LCLLRLQAKQKRDGRLRRGEDEGEVINKRKRKGCKELKIKREVNVRG
jgi:hypothetical protein